MFYYEKLLRHPYFIYVHDYFPGMQVGFFNQKDHANLMRCTPKECGEMVYIPYESEVFNQNVDAYVIKDVSSSK